MARTKLMMSIVVIAAVAIVVSLLWIYYSPEYSWDASIRDSDGDGYPDDTDPYPNDPQKWTSPSVTPTTSITKIAVVNGFKFVIGSGAEVPWSDVTILLSAGIYHEYWENISSSDLDDSVDDSQDYGSEYLGDLCVSLIVTDVDGNGQIDEGDFFTLTAEEFSDETTYYAILMHDPTAGQIAICEFTA